MGRGDMRAVGALAIALVVVSLPEFGEAAKEVVELSNELGHDIDRESFDVKLERFLARGGNLVDALRGVSEEQELGESAGGCAAMDREAMNAELKHSTKFSVSMTKVQGGKFTKIVSGEHTKKALVIPRVSLSGVTWKPFVYGKLAKKSFSLWKSAECQAIRKDFSEHWAKKCVLVPPSEERDDSTDLGEDATFQGAYWWRDRRIRGMAMPPNSKSTHYLIWLLSRRLQFDSYKAEKAFMKNIWGRCDKRPYPDADRVLIKLHHDKRWCIALKGAKQENGAVALGRCMDPPTEALMWAYDKTKNIISYKADKSLCMAPKTVKQSSEIVLKKCDGSDAQQWLKAGLNLKLKANPKYCLDLPRFRRGVGRALKLNKCNKRWTSERWSVPKF